MTFAIPLHLYVEGTESQARAYKAKLEELLRNPMLKVILDPQVPNRGFVVSDPIAMPDQR